MAAPRLVMILTENQPMLDPRDVRGLLDLARSPRPPGSMRSW